MWLSPKELEEESEKDDCCLTTSRFSKEKNKKITGFLPNHEKTDGLSGKALGTHLTHSGERSTLQRPCWHPSGSSAGALLERVPLNLMSLAHAPRLPFLKVVSRTGPGRGWKTRPCTVCRDLASVTRSRAGSILAAPWESKGSPWWGMGVGVVHGFSETHPAHAWVPRVAFAQGNVSSE